METRRERTYERSDPLLSSEVDEPIRTGTRAVEIHPDRPVLHFLAQAVPINKFVISHEKYHPAKDEHPFTPHLKRQLFNKSWIYDSARHHCGTLVGLGSWPPDNGDQDSKGPNSKYDLILLSRCHPKVVTDAHIEENSHRLPLEFPSS